jgi:hypothetical protein
MPEDSPDNPSGKSGGQGRGPRDEGQGKRNGRHRGFRGRHGPKREGPQRGGEQQPKQGPEPQRQGAGQGQERSGRGGEQGQRAREQRQPRPVEGEWAEQPERLEPVQRPESARDMPACPICNKPVYDLSTAVSASRESGEPAHFDCVLERVQASESLGPGEKLVYLGSGGFAVVTFKDRNEAAFTVVRRVQWEKEGEKKEWRKGLSSRIANL